MRYECRVQSRDMQEQAVLPSVRKAQYLAKGFAKKGWLRFSTQHPQRACGVAEKSMSYISQPLHQIISWRPWRF